MKREVYLHCRKRGPCESAINAATKTQIDETKMTQKITVRKNQRKAEKYQSECTTRINNSTKTTDRGVTTVTTPNRVSER